MFFAMSPVSCQLLILASSIRHRLRRSLLIVAGDLTAAAFGLAAIIAHSASAFLWIKWPDVAYLARIGLQRILPRHVSPGVIDRIYGGLMTTAARRRSPKALAPGRQATSLTDSARRPSAQARAARPSAWNRGRDTGSWAARYSGCHWTDRVKPGASAI